ncbi:MAG TPA: amidase family protein, partial [Reyranella sp.]
QYLPKWQNQMDPVTLAFMERGAKFTLADFRNAQFARTALFRKIQSLLERYDFLVTPTNSRTALDVTHDAAIMHSVLVGPSDKDPWTLAGGGQRPLSPKLSGEDLSGVRIGYIELTANPRIAADVRANTRSALAAWQEMGAAVEEVTEKIDWIEYEGRVLYQANFAVFCAQYLPKWQNQMDPVTLAFMERGAKFTLADFRNAQFARTALFRKIQSLLERYDFLVTPTNSRTALDVIHDAANDEVVVDGVKCGITRQGWTSYQYPFNLTGHPALALPSGFGADGLPTSVQIVGKWGAETDVLRLGALLERARPWAQHRPPQA